MSDKAPTQTTETARQRLERRLSAIGVPVSALPFQEAIDAMIAEERERCATIARNGANFFRDKPIKFVTPEKYAADLADDIADAIESGAPP